MIIEGKCAIELGHSDSVKAREIQPSESQWLSSNNMPISYCLDEGAEWLRPQTTK